MEDQFGVAQVVARRGVFRFGNLSGDAVTQANVGVDCYIVDDQTVAKTDGADAQPRGQGGGDRYQRRLGADGSRLLSKAPIMTNPLASPSIGLAVLTLRVLPGSPRIRVILPAPDVPRGAMGGSAVDAERGGGLPGSSPS